MYVINDIFMISHFVLEKYDLLLNIYLRMLKVVNVSPCALISDFN